MLVIAVIWLCYRFYKKRKGLRSGKSIKSSKELAEELFSPEGEKRNYLKKSTTTEGVTVGDDDDDDDDDNIYNTKG